MFSTVQKGIRWGICHVISRFEIANKYINDYDKIKNRHVLSITM